MIAREKLVPVLLILGLYLLPAALLSLQDGRIYDSFAARDFIAFWSGARAWSLGQNPYDLATLLEIQRALDPAIQSPQAFLNPPWVLPIFSPFALLPFWTARWLWLFLNLSILSFSLFTLRRLCRPLSQTQEIAAYLSLPALYALQVGQSTLLLLPALIGLITAPQRLRTGILLSLCAIKPHLLLLGMFPAFRQILAERHWRLLVGCIGSALLLVLIAVLRRPEIFAEWRAMEFDTLQWRTSTLVTLLRDYFQMSDSRQAIGIALGVQIAGIAIAFFLLRFCGCKALSLQGITLLTPLSLLCAPYAFLYDYCLLLPAQFYLAAKTRYGLQFVIAAQLAVLGAGCIFVSLESFTFLPAAFLIAAIVSELKSNLLPAHSPSTYQSRHRDA